MKRTETKIRASLLLKPHVAADDIHNVIAGAHLLNQFI